jgi:hypothetical protein
MAISTRTTSTRPAPCLIVSSPFRRADVLATRKAGVSPVPNQRWARCVALRERPRLRSADCSAAMQRRPILCFMYKHAAKNQMNLRSLLKQAALSYKNKWRSPLLLHSSQSRCAYMRIMRADMCAHTYLKFVNLQRIFTSFETSSHPFPISAPPSHT